MRVVVTGMGVLSPLGNTLDSYWEGLQQGKSGIQRISAFDVSRSRCQTAGIVQDFDPSLHFSKKELKSLDRFSQLGGAAAQMAWEHAQLSSAPEQTLETNVIVGTGIGGIMTMKNAYDALYAEAEERRINSYAIPRIMNNSLSSQIAIRLGIRGRNITLNTACSSGGHAIGQAFEWIRNGQARRVVCGGAEAPITYELLRAWESLGVLSEYAPEEGGVCRPFDQRRDGFALAEGAGILILEALESALNRQVPIYGELIGYGANCDAYHLTLPAEQGIAEAMRLALQDAGIEKREVDYINAHGTGTRINDVIETKAIHQVFEEYATAIPVSSNKSMLGHSMGASSALELIATVLTVQQNLIPPTMHYAEPDPECDLNYVPNEAARQTVNIALSNSFAFGGSNAVLVVKKWVP